MLWWWGGGGWGVLRCDLSHFWAVGLLAPESCEVEGVIEFVLGICTSFLGHIFLGEC